MAFWQDKPPSPTHLRLFEPEHGWRAHDDAQDAEGKTTSFGASRSIEMALSTALNASNLVLLTGAGTSLSAVNPNGPTAPMMPALWDAVEAAVTPDRLAAVIKLIPAAASPVKNIEKLLTLCKLYGALFDNNDAKMIASFLTDAEPAIVARADFVSDATNLASHRAMVRKIARRGIRKPRARIFTTNYDLCFEYAAREQQFVLTDGFSHSNPQVYDRAHFAYDIVRREGDQDAPNYIENVFHLYKLHGSIDWRRKGSRIIRSRDPADGLPVLIYPRDTKFQEAFEPPYLDMMGAFQTAIRDPDTALIVCGFGFSDDHISKPVMAAVQANISLKVIICDLTFLDDASLESQTHVISGNAPMRTANANFRMFKTLVSAGDRRISLINGRFEDLALAVPDLVAQTERERHFDRMQSIAAMPGAGAGK